MHSGRCSCVKLSPYQPGPSPHCLGSLILGLNLEFSSAFLFHGCLFQEVFPGLVLSRLFPTPGVLSKRDGRQRAPSVYSTWLSNRAPMILKMITRHAKEVHICQEFWWEPIPREEWLRTPSFLTIYSLRMPNPSSSLMVPVFLLAIVEAGHP